MIPKCGDWVRIRGNDYTIYNKEGLVLAVRWDDTWPYTSARCLVQIEGWEDTPMFIHSDYITILKQPDPVALLGAEYFW